MPRFFPSPVPAFGSPPLGQPKASFASPTFATPSPGFSSHRESNITPPSSSSLRLSCSSPDGKSVHSLMITSSDLCYIETHTLPLAGTVDPTSEETNYEQKASIIRTPLPGHVFSALSRYPAIELVCVGGDSSATATATTKTSQRNSTTVPLPLLCLYTKKDVFLLDICYEPTGAPEVEGTVVSIDEPYDDFLMSNSTLNIIRIQPAPQLSCGYPNICPVGAMAMLTQDHSTKFYTLTLYHGPSLTNVFSMQSSTTSHEIQTEELDDPMERIVDFCFCRSSTFSLLSSVTAAFLKGNGQVLFATPIMFRGMVVASAVVSETLDFLEASIQMEKPYTAFFNQYATARRFFSDAFPNIGQSNFVTTALGTTRNLQVFEWGVQIQGPLIELPPLPLEETNQAMSKSIVPFDGAGDLIGLAIGYTSEVVDIAVASPTVLVPRFKFESDDDADELDSSLAYGVCVDRIEFSSGGLPSHNICLIADPISECVVHLVTPTHIYCVFSNVALITSNKAREYAIRETNADMLQGILSPPSKRADLKPKTTAWSCLNVSFFQGNQNPLVGALVSSNIEFGHTLVARLRNGKMIAVNLTNKQHLHEMDTVAVQQSDEVLAITDGSQETESLANTIQPLIQKVYNGISKMAQIGGSSTPPDDISVDVLAGAMSIYEKTKKEVYLPLVEMNEYVAARREEMKNGVVQKQQEAIKALLEVISKLREKQSAIQERMDVLFANSKALEARSSSALQSSKDLQPTITQAEYDYFQEVKRLEDKTTSWEGEAEILKVKVASVTDSIENGAMINLSEENLGNAKQLLQGTEKYIEKGWKDIRSLSSKVDQLATYTGYIS
jgi:hypothetical protein